MDAIFIDIKTTGNAPIYSQISHMTLADLSQSPVRVSDIVVATLNDELKAIKSLIASLEGQSLVLIRDDFVVNYLKECCKQYNTSFSLPKTDYLYKYVSQIESKVDIPSFEGELKHFYKDYKNYYYLPLEDTAYHKSVAEWVDKSARVQATARTAYTKMTGTFIPVYPDLSNYISPDLIFQSEYRKAPLYVPKGYIDLSDSKVIASYMFRSHIDKDA